MSARDVCPKCGSMYSLHDPKCFSDEQRCDECGHLNCHHMPREQIISFSQFSTKKNANETVRALITEELLTFLLDQADQQFATKNEKRAFVIGGASAIGYYGKELKKGLSL